MKISVIVTAYQAEAYLMRCILSLLNQTFKNTEIIIVNDGSTDCTKEIANYLKITSTNIKVIHQPNKGVMKARFNGLKQAHGDYILFVDVDDWLDSYTLEYLSDIAKKESPDLIFYNAYHINSKREKIPLQMLTESCKIINEDPLKAFFDAKMYPALWSKLIKKSYLCQDKIKIPLDITIGEDLALTGSLMMHHPKISYCPHHLYYYVHHSDSLSNQLDTHHLQLFQALDFLGEQLIEHQLFDLYKVNYIQLGYSHIQLLHKRTTGNLPLQKQVVVACEEWLAKYNYL